MSEDLKWLYIWILKLNMKVTYIYRIDNAFKIYLGDDVSDDGETYAVLQ